MLNKSIRGFYYDLQQYNPITRISLHANTYPSIPEGDNKQVVWKSVKDNPDTEYFKERYKDLSIGIDETGVDLEGYCNKPLCTSIIGEDFNVSIANSWTEFGGDPLGEMWNSLKPLAPYSEFIAGSIKKIADEQTRLNPVEDQLVNSSWVAKFLKGLVNELNDTVNKDVNGNKAADGTESKFTDYLNRSLVVQGSRFSFYSGTGVSFSNLSMKFTVFPKWINGRFYTVMEQIDLLDPFFHGKYELAKLPDTIKSLEGFIAWQKPPGGFSANMKNIDLCQKGTLKLRFGPYYSISNLVCESATYNYSRQMVKNPIEVVKVLNSKGNGGSDTVAAPEELSTSIISPLFCEVNINLRPATKYSDQALRSFVKGVHMAQQTGLVNTALSRKLKELNKDV